MFYTDITIKGGGYEASFRSDLGGNCYRLIEIVSGAEILRTPSNEEELKAGMYLYGNPILFPPNRIKGGKFEFEGREYNFPINEIKTGCHIHGELYKTSFEIEAHTEDSVVFFCEFSQFEYIGFPHAFSVRRKYELTSDGLMEAVEVKNLSDENMPFMLAFHTTLNIPFLENGNAEECYAKIEVGREQLRNENYLPTLSYVGGRQRENELSSGEYRISEAPISACYEAQGKATVITDRSCGRAVIYEADEAYKYRMLWRGTCSSFFVAEPQTSAIDCFHLELPAEEKGLIVIPPHKTAVLNTRFAII